MNRLMVYVSVMAALGLWACGDKQAKSEKSPEDKAAEKKAKVVKAIRSEADLNLRKLFDGSIVYYNTPPAYRPGSSLLSQFPYSAETPADWKAKVCPEKGKPAKKYTPNEKTWADETWQRLDFAVSDPFYNRYVYESKGQGTEAKGTIKAISDPNCDGNEVVVELKFKVNDENEVVKVQ